MGSGEEGKRWQWMQSCIPVMRCRPEIFLLSRKHDDLLALCRTLKQIRSWFAVSSFLGLFLGKNTGNVHKLWPPWLMATWHWEVLCFPAGCGWVSHAEHTHNCSRGWGWPGEDPSCPQRTAYQERGKPAGEAGSRMGYLEIQIIVRERRRRTEGWRTKWGRGSRAGEEREESGRANWGKPREEKAFQKAQCGFSRFWWQREVRWGEGWRATHGFANQHVIDNGFGTNK